jgi:hypothetical protein
MKQRELRDNSVVHQFRRRVNNAVIAPRRKRSAVISA